MRNHRFLLGCVLFLVLAALTVPASGGPPTETLQRQVDIVIKLLDDPGRKDRLEERRAQVKKAAEEIFDYPDTARRALGSHWNARTPAEREQFTRLFADLLDRAYISRIDLYQGEKVKYVSESITGDEAIVRTTIQTRSGTEVPIEYRMHIKNDRWLVYDVIIEGVSMVSNYRTQFNKIVQTESYDSLVQKLRARGAAPSASPAGRR